MKQIGDDPIVRCMECSGYPPWFCRDGADCDERDGDTACGEDNDGN